MTPDKHVSSSSSLLDQKFGPNDYRPDERFEAILAVPLVNPAVFCAEAVERLGARRSAMVRRSISARRGSVRRCALWPRTACETLAREMIHASRSLFAAASSAVRRSTSVPSLSRVILASSRSLRQLGDDRGGVGWKGVENSRLKTGLASMTTPSNGFRSRCRNSPVLCADSGGC